MFHRPGDLVELVMGKFERSMAVQLQQSISLKITAAEFIMLQVRSREQEFFEIGLQQVLVHVVKTEVFAKCLTKQVTNVDSSAFTKSTVTAGAFAQYNYFNCEFILPFIQDASVNPLFYL